MIEKIEEHIKNNRDIIFDTGASLVSILFSENPVAQLAPAVASVILGCRQKKTNKLITVAIDEIRKDIDILKKHLKEMSNREIEFVDKSMMIAFENITKEMQEEKIKFIVNGLKTIISNNITNENIVVAYYDILNDLRIIDVRILVDLYEERKKRNKKI